MSERRACRALGQPRTTNRRSIRPNTAERVLFKEIARLAAQHPHYGYRRLTALLRTKGLRVNPKRVHRICTREYLLAPHRRRKKRPTDSPTVVTPSAHRPNDIWAWDLITDHTAGGRQLRWFSVVDEFTRECVALEIAHRWSPVRMINVLTKAVAERGSPRIIRSDNGSDFLADELEKWLQLEGIRMERIAPGAPWENRFVESFQSRLRVELL